MNLLSFLLSNLYLLSNQTWSSAKYIVWDCSPCNAGLDRNSWMSLGSILHRTPWRTVCWYNADLPEDLRKKEIKLLWNWTLKDPFIPSTPEMLLGMKHIYETSPEESQKETLKFGWFVSFQLAFHSFFFFSLFHQPSRKKSKWMENECFLEQQQKKKIKNK